MMDFMRDGGMTMWLLLVTAVVTFGVAATRGDKARSTVLFAGLVIVLIEGMLGLSTGLIAVSAHFGQFPDKVEALGVGLGELANNGILASILAVLLGVASIAARTKESATA